jgi:hypothetical protein
MAASRLIHRSLLGLVAAVLLVGFNAGSSSGYDNYAYNNLLRSRDALVDQRAELERARTDVLGQIDKLNARVARIDSYLKQVDSSITDVNAALKSVR